jgi:hypothetical protein
MGRARTRENFPRMKLRGGRRRRNAEIVQAWRAVNAIDFAALGRALESVGRAAIAMVEAISAAANRMVRTFRTALWVANRNTRIQWIATHQLPAHPSPWAAPITKETP